MTRLLTLLISSILILTGCVIQPITPMGEEINDEEEITIDFSRTVIVNTPHNEPTTPCEDTFIAHDLDHITTVIGDVVRLYDSNGSGLAINDLDNDGDLDIVLGNLAGANAIFWNEGGADTFPIFSKEELLLGRTRSINIVDFDGDGWQDIVFARQQARPTLWRNVGIAEGDTQPIFEDVKTTDLWVNAFTTSWADLNGDGDLDMVAASYDTEYTRGDPGASGGGGVAVFDNQGAGDTYESEGLAFSTQALAILLEDINDDGAVDVLVGNDFFLKDLVWLQQDGAWEEIDPFPVMSMNTMSYATGDVNNDGQRELFAGDMLPYQADEKTMSKWMPVVEHIEMIPGDPQIMANVLHVYDTDNQENLAFVNQAEALGIAAAGWSWSAQFGDLDNDGLLDLYIVNGMNAEELFAHLPGNELVEENLVFRNEGDDGFVVQDWGLNSTLSGRSMSMADLDQDGDLDIVVNNLLGPAQIFENRLCGGDGLTVDLHWSSSQNTRAVGATVMLHTSDGVYQRDVRTASGYLSGVPAQVHFGVPEGSVVEALEIVWPDGEVTMVEDITTGMLVSVTR
ncbi:MAG: CRTAC1 family protein [Chloroflexota bacterium]